MKKKQENQLASMDVNPYEMLSDKDKLAVDLAVENVPYKFIAKKFKYEHQTVAKWFMKGGRLHEALVYQRKQLRKEYAKLFKQIDQQIQDGAVEAIVKIRTSI